jgi:Nif-specific regulatory protein
VATLIAQFLSINQQVEAKVENLRRENVSLKYQLSQESRGLYIVGKSLSMQEVQRQIEKVAPTRATVLLLGESGTGKTLIGRIIHDLSDRNGFPFIKFNCASIPENLLESELFGYEKGAFTGADAPSPGRFEDAHKGTTFWTRSGNCPWGFRPSFCACCRTGNSSVWAATGPGAWMCASWPPPTRTWGRWPSPGRSGRTFITD